MSFNILELDRIIEMAWEDRTTFEAIEHQFKISARVQGRKTKHQKLRTFESGRFKCTRQRQITHNKISKR